MMRYALIATTLLLATALAGCGEDSPGPPGASIADSDDGPAGLAAPSWQVGDWWRYTFPGGGEATSVVTEETSSTWTLDTDNADFAFDAAVFDPTPFVGAISREDLSGEEDGETVRLFAWPLTDGKNWTLQWDGLAWSVEAREVGEEAYEMTAVADDGSETRIYRYDNRTKWLASITALDANGTELWGTSVTGSGQDYVGQYVRWDLGDLVDASVTGVGEGRTLTFNVPADATDVWLRVVGWCEPGGVEGDQGFFAIAVGPAEVSDGPPPGLAYEAVWPCPFDELVQEDLEPQAGTWQVTTQALGGSADVLVMPRTLRTFTL